MEKQTTTTMTTPESFVDVLGELHEMVSSTYKDLQVSLQQQEQQQQHQLASKDDSTATAKTIETNMATFNLAMGAALQKINTL